MATKAYASIYKKIHFSHIFLLDYFRLIKTQQVPLKPVVNGLKQMKQLYKCEYSDMQQNGKFIH